MSLCRVALEGVPAGAGPVGAPLLGLECCHRIRVSYEMSRTRSPDHGSLRAPLPCPPRARIPCCVRAQVSSAAGGTTRPGLEGRAHEDGCGWGTSWAPMHFSAWKVKVTVGVSRLPGDGATGLPARTGSLGSGRTMSQEVCCIEVPRLRFCASLR